MSVATAAPTSLLRVLASAPNRFDHRPTFVTDLPEAAYHADPVKGGSVAASGLKVLINGSPADYQWQLEHRSGSTEATEAGSLLHAEVLGTPLDHEIVNMATTRNKASDEVRSRGLVPVTETMLDQAAAMAAAVHSHPEAAELLAAAPFREVSMFTLDRPSGLWVRGRADALGETEDGRPLVVDLKTTAAGVSPAEISKVIGQYDYHVQDAHYTEIVASLLGLGDSGALDVDFAFIFVSKTVPHRVAVVRLEQPTKLQGRRETRQALSMIAACRKSGDWPGWGSFTVNLPAWRIH